MSVDLPHSGLRPVTGKWVFHMEVSRPVTGDDWSDGGVPHGGLRLVTGNVKATVTRAH